MASKGKTPRLGLNAWDGTDTPLRIDFNADNTLIDTALGAHLAKTSAHLSDDERARFNAPFLIGSYNGDGQTERTFSVGFKPRMGLVLSVDSYLAHHLSLLDVTYQGMAIATSMGCSIGISLTNTGFTVVNIEGDMPIEDMPVLNRLDASYVYVMMK